MKRIAMLTLPLILFASFAWAASPHMTSPTICNEGYYARGIGVDGSAASCTQDVVGEGGEGELFGGSFSDLAGSIADAQLPDSNAMDSELHTATTSGDITHDSTSGGTADNAHHNKSHDNTDHSTNYAVAGGGEHDGFSDFVENEHLLPATLAGEGLTDNGTALDVDANIRADSRRAQWFSPEDADSNVLLFRATGAGVVTEIECFATGGGTTIVVYKNSAASISNGTFTCTSDTWVSDTALTNTTISDNDYFYVDIIAANSASKIFVQINYTE